MVMARPDPSVLCIHNGGHIRAHARVRVAPNCCRWRLASGHLALMSSVLAPIALFHNYNYSRILIDKQNYVDQRNVHSNT